MTDEELWDAFARSALPASAWTHSAHLRVAILHVDRWSVHEAHLRARVGIIRLNAAHGLVETTERGYHETLTRVWIACLSAIRADDARRGLAAGDSLAFCERHPEILERTYPLRYYSKARLFSVEARAVFVPPDLAELPA